MITDLDLDSAREVVWVDEDHGRVGRFECVADNEYERRSPLPMGAGLPICFTWVPDIDRDSVPECAAGGDQGVITVYEPVADDSFLVRARGSMTPLFQYPMVMAPAPDLDRDGRTELVVVGTASTCIFEAPADDSLELVWSYPYWGASYGHSVAVGDVDGDSEPEFMACNGDSLWLFRCTGNDEYEQFWALGGGVSVATLYDINSDGRDELLHGIRFSRITVIREWLPVGVEERVAEALRRVTVAPSVARRSDVVRVDGLPQSADCEVVDTSGRIVASLASGVWRPTSNGAGAYFVRIRLGGQTVDRKVLVVD
jgi:hypothetical protein